MKMPLRESGAKPLGDNLIGIIPLTRLHEFIYITCQEEDKRGALEGQMAQNRFSFYLPGNKQDSVAGSGRTHLIRRQSHLLRR